MVPNLVGVELHNSPIGPPNEITTYMNTTTTVSTTAIKIAPKGKEKERKAPVIVNGKSSPTSTAKTPVKTGAKSPPNKGKNVMKAGRSKGARPAAKKLVEGLQEAQQQAAGALDCARQIISEQRPLSSKDKLRLETEEIWVERQKQNVSPANLSSKVVPANPVGSGSIFGRLLPYIPRFLRGYVQSSPSVEWKVSTVTTLPPSPLYVGAQFLAVGFVRSLTTFLGGLAKTAANYLPSFLGQVINLCPGLSQLTKMFSLFGKVSWIPQVFLGIMFLAKLGETVIDLIDPVKETSLVAIPHSVETVLSKNLVVPLMDMEEVIPDQVVVSVQMAVKEVRMYSGARYHLNANGFQMPEFWSDPFGYLFEKRVDLTLFQELCNRKTELGFRGKGEAELHRVTRFYETAHRSQQNIEDKLIRGVVGRDTSDLARAFVLDNPSPQCFQ